MAGRSGFSAVLALLPVWNVVKGLPWRYILPAMALLALHHHIVATNRREAADAAASGVRTQWQKANDAMLAATAKAQGELDQKAALAESDRLAQTAHVKTIVARSADALQNIGDDEDKLYSAARAGVRELRDAGGLAADDVA